MAHVYPVRGWGDVPCVDPLAFRPGTAALELLNVQLEVTKNYRTILIAVGVLAIASAAVAQAQSGRQTTTAQTTTAPAVPARQQSVASLASTGFLVRAAFQNPSDSKQVILTLQKESEVFMCPVWAAVSFALPAGYCVKAQ